MNSKRLVLYLVLGLITLAVVGYVLTGYMLTPEQNTPLVLTPSTDEAPFQYETFIASNPAFAVEMSMSAEHKYKQLARQLEAALPTVLGRENQAYGRYVITRVYINAVIGDPQDSDSLARAVALAGHTIGDTQEYPHFRAYTVDMFDTLLYPHMPESVARAITQDTYFQKFAEHTDGTRLALRENLLQYGDALARMTNLKMKLALLSTMRLRALAALPASTERDQRMTELRQMISDQMSEADDSLVLDRAGDGPFHNMSYLPEPLYSKAQAAEAYEQALSEAPFGSVKTLYEEALASARLHFPAIVPYIERSLTSYQGRTKS